MDSLAIAAQERPDGAAVVAADRTVDYAELDRAAWGVASIIAASGSVGKGVAFWGDRTVEAIAAAWGIRRVGMAAVPVDPRLPPAAAMDMTRAAGVRGLWTEPEGGFDALVARGIAGRDAAAPARDGGFVVFTSGTEGTPKGVRLDAANIEAAVTASRLRLGNGRDDGWLLVLPLFHVGGLSVLWRQAEAAAPVVVLERFEPAAVERALESTAYVSLVPVMLRRLLDDSSGPISGLRVVLVGGAAADTDLLAEARDRGLPAVPTYGMTETCSQVATPSPRDPLDGSVGPPLDGVEVSIVDAEGDDGVGRIRVRGPTVMRGYLGEPDRDPDEWFTTNDLGFVDGDGRLTVLGRADDAFIIGGEIVHPGAVARVLLKHDRVDAVQIIGEPDAEWGTRLIAEVAAPGLSTDVLDSWAARHLSPAMRPREWRLVEEEAGS